MPNIPKCANALEGICPKSDTYISKERDDCFVITCRTCRCINIWPKPKEEKMGRYEAGLKREAIKNEKEEFFARKRAYSVLGGK